MFRVNVCKFRDQLSCCLFSFHYTFAALTLLSSCWRGTYNVAIRQTCVVIVVVFVHLSQTLYIIIIPSCVPSFQHYVYSRMLSVTYHWYQNVLESTQYNVATGHIRWRRWACYKPMKRATTNTCRDDYNHTRRLRLLYKPVLYRRELCGFSVNMSMSSLRDFRFPSVVNDDCYRESQYCRRRLYDIIENFLLLSWE